MTNLSKNEKLEKQYPFVGAILNQWMWPLAPWHENLNNAKRADKLTIKVEIADGDLMYRRSNFIGYDNCSAIFAFGGKHKGHIGLRGEHLFAVDGENKIINRLDWPRTQQQKWAKGETYGHLVLWRKEESRGWYSDPIWKQTEYIALVEIETWYEHIQGESDCYQRGEFLERIVKVTIYRRPKIGFEKLQDQSCLEDNLCLDSKVLLDAMLEDKRDIIAITGQLTELGRYFTDKVYNKGLRDVLIGYIRGTSKQEKVLCAEFGNDGQVVLENLDSALLLNALFKNNKQEIVAISGQLTELGRLFQDEVYLKGMREVLDNGKVRGASGNLGPVRVLCAEMCGYERVMLENSSCWISLQLRPESKRMYVLGMGGTLPRLRDLVRTAVTMWAKPEARGTFRSDGNVSVI